MTFTMPFAALGLVTVAIAADEAATTASTTASTTAAAFSVDTPIEALMADERAKAVVTMHFGGMDLTTHPAYEQFKALSLKTLAPFSQGLITEETLTKIAADLTAIK